MRVLHDFYHVKMARLRPFHCSNPSPDLFRESFLPKDLAAFSEVGTLYACTVYLCFQLTESGQRRL